MMRVHSTRVAGSVPVYAFLLLLAGALGAAVETITLDYTAENLITEDDRVFQATLRLHTAKRPLHDIMFEAAALDPRFMFRTRVHPEFGHFVTEMNNISEDLNAQRYWALLKRDHPETPGTDCSLSHAGVSSYVPYDGEHLVFTYASYVILEKIPPCPIPGL